MLAQRVDDMEYAAELVGRALRRDARDDVDHLRSP
jgi:hypothetical protein